MQNPLRLYRFGQPFRDRIQSGFPKNGEFSMETDSAFPRRIILAAQIREFFFWKALLNKNSHGIK
jgi:hypothetical protein